MKACDDCAEVVPRRRRCWHCGLWVCGYCWHHVHACEPGHSRKECDDLKRLDYMRAYGKAACATYLNRLRLLALADPKGRKENHALAE